jgi:hypothetical protein
MKIHPVGAQLFHADQQTHRQAGRKTDRQDRTEETYGPTDMIKLIAAFSNFANKPKNANNLISRHLKKFKS